MELKQVFLIAHIQNCVFFGISDKNIHCWPISASDSEIVQACIVILMEMLKRKNYCRTQTQRVKKETLYKGFY